MMLSKHAKLLLIGSSIWYFGEGMLGPIFALFTARIGGSILDITWIWATYLIVTGLFTVLIGKISDDRYSKEELLVAGYALNAVFTFGYLFATTPGRLLFVQAGLGLASALATPTWDALYAKQQDQNTAGMTWGLAGGQAEFVTGLAVLVGGALVNYYSFTLLFVIMGLVQTLAAVYQAQILFSRPDAPVVLPAVEPGRIIQDVVERSYRLTYQQPSLSDTIVQHSITIQFKDANGRVIDVLNLQQDAAATPHSLLSPSAANLLQATHPQAAMSGRGT